LADYELTVLRVGVADRSRRRSPITLPARPGERPAADFLPLLASPEPVGAAHV